MSPGSNRYIDQTTMRIGALTAWLTVPDPAETISQKAPEATAPKVN
jgi:hypothetical protein